MHSRIINSIDEVWNDIHCTKEWGKYPSEEVIRFVAKYYYKNERDHIKILDYGCGQGANTWYLAREGFDTYAFDGAEHAVRRTIDYLNKEGLHGDVKLLDGIATNYENGYFDAIIDNCCIGCSTLKNIIKMYEETYRILKDGGRLFTAFLSSETTGYGLGTKVEDDTYKDIPYGPVSREGTIHFWTKSSLIKVLEQVGYDDIRSDSLTITSELDKTVLLITTCRKVK